MTTEKIVQAQSIDFVERFGDGIKTLKDVLGVQRTLVLPIGATVKTYKSTVTLDGGKVAEGEIIPLSKVKREVADTFELDFDKRRKAVPVEDVQRFGFLESIAQTDHKLVRELQKGVRKKLFDNLEKGTAETKGAGLQGALAKAWGTVQTVFEDDGVGTIAFVNPTDVADYLAKGTITTQNAFGITYVKDFLNINTLIISSAVPAKKVYATAPENLVFAFAKVDGGEISKAFDFITDETGVIGITHDVDTSRLTAETTTLSASVLFAERLDGVVKVSIEEAVL